MRSPFKIVIPGPPIPQLRHRKGKWGNIYDPCKKQKVETRDILKKDIAECFFHFPRVSFIFHMPIPKRLPKPILQEYTSGRRKHLNKPDADNFEKFYLDCMTEIFFEDDRRVSFGEVVKLYHPEPKTLIYINETSETLCPDEVSPHIWADLFGQEPS